MARLAQRGTQAQNCHLFDVHLRQNMKIAEIPPMLFTATLDYEPREWTYLPFLDSP